MSVRLSPQGTGQLNCEGPFLGRRDDQNVLNMEEGPSKGIAWEQSDSEVQRHWNLTIWNPQRQPVPRGAVGVLRLSFGVMVMNSVLSTYNCNMPDSLCIS